MQKWLELSSFGYYNTPLRLSTIHCLTIYSSLGLDFDYSVFCSDSETSCLHHLGCVVIVLEKTALLITMVGEKTLMGGIPGDVSITACRTSIIRRDISDSSSIGQLRSNLIARNDEEWKYDRENAACNDLRQQIRLKPSIPAPDSPGGW